MVVSRIALPLKMNSVYIGVGSNRDAKLHLTHAYQQLDALTSGLRSSPIYRSKAYGFESSDFYNAVFSCQTELSYDDFNVLLKQIEMANDRRKPASEYDVSLDLDILLYGDLCDVQMRLPRADIYSYDFVLKPLVELAPELVLPDTQKTVLELWNEKRAEFDAQALQKVEINL